MPRVPGRVEFVLRKARLALLIAAVFAWQPANAAADANEAVLPPAAEGVTDLKFRELYKMPIGPRGLEPSEKLLALDNKRVRLVGYMVHEDEPQAGVIILSPFPVSAPDAEDGPADDYPPQIVYVHLRPGQSAGGMPWTPQLLVFEGTLELGPREESDGRVSAVRLIVH